MWPSGLFVNWPLRLLHSLDLSSDSGPLHGKVQPGLGFLLWTSRHTFLALEGYFGLIWSNSFLFLEVSEAEGLAQLCLLIKFGTYLSSRPAWSSFQPGLPGLAMSNTEPCVCFYVPMALIKAESLHYDRYIRVDEGSTKKTLIKHEHYWSLLCFHSTSVYLLNTCPVLTAGIMLL